MSASPSEIHLIRGTFGCPCGQHVARDPYWLAEDWHAAARGDGGSYSGTVEVLARELGESDADLVARADRRAAEIERQERAEGYGCDR